MEIARPKTSSCTFLRLVDWAKLENLLEFGNRIEGESVDNSISSWLISYILLEV